MNTHSELEPDTMDEHEEHELCTQCLTGNQPGSDFCCKCGAPLSAYAAIGPFERLFAEGHVYRRASEQPQRLIVVVGMWIIFGGMALGGAAVAAMGFESGDAVSILPGLALLTFSAVIITKTTRNYRRRRLPANEANDQ